MKRKATWTPRLNFYMVIPFPSLLYMNYSPSLLFTSFPFIIFFPKLVRPFMLGYWTFTPGSFYIVFLPCFSSLSFYFYFSGGIYRVLLGSLMDSNIDRLKLSSLIKMREFWTNVNNQNLYLLMVLGQWFCNKIT